MSYMENHTFGKSYGHELSDEINSILKVFDKLFDDITKNNTMSDGECTAANHTFRVLDNKAGDTVMNRTILFRDNIIARHCNYQGAGYFSFSRTDIFNLFNKLGYEYEFVITSQKVNGDDYIRVSDLKVLLSGDETDAIRKLKKVIF